jgi:hypothetical protein
MCTFKIAYCDNANALLLQAHSSDTPGNRAILCGLLERALGFQSGVLHLTAIRSYFWASGTHYFDPLRPPYVSRQDFLYKAQRPTVGVHVVGECVALHQGWVEGALETVENILSDIFARLDASKSGQY